MLIYKNIDWKGGWFIGDFTPTSFETKKFEVGFKKFKKGEFSHPHFHKIATEINYVASGKVVINGFEFKTGDVFILEKNEVVYPLFQEDCDLVVVKIPSAANDKFLIKND